MKKQTLTRKTTFDAGHRVMNEKMKCFNLHGHTYICELTFQFKEMEDIGYAIDFKEIKRIGVQWIEDMLDHGFIANPLDFVYIDACTEEGSKLWLMGLNGENTYCNPTAENISKEIFLAMQVLFEGWKGLKIKEIKLWETPNSSVTCKKKSISKSEKKNWYRLNYDNVKKYAVNKGIIQYDDRK